MKNNMAINVKGTSRSHLLRQCRLAGTKAKGTNRSHLLQKCGLAVILAGLLFAYPIGKPGSAQNPPQTFCITDSNTGANIRFTLDGTYSYTTCDCSASLTGQGTVFKSSGVVMLVDKKPDRSVKAGLILGQNTGTASIYIRTAPGIFQFFSIHQTIPDRECGCVAIGPAC